MRLTGPAGEQASLSPSPAAPAQGVSSAATAASPQPAAAGSGASGVSAAGATTAAGNPRAGKPGRPYLYEVDLVRIVTALCVVGVHAAAFTVLYNHTPLGQDLQNGVVIALHYTRSVFLSITAFVLTYGYAHRRYSLKKFWWRRGLGVLLPYIAFSFFYVWFSTPHHPFGSWLSAAALHTLKGDASYQLYYILLSIEFYILMPVFLWLMAKVERFPWKLLIGSFLIEMALMYLNYHYLQASAFSHTNLGRWLNDYGWRLLPFYIFYMVLGYLAATYLVQVRTFLLRHGWWVVAVISLALASVWLRYLYALRVEHYSVGYATSVFQPSMVFYSGAVALFLYWVGCRWALRGPDHVRPDGEKPRGARVVAVLSDAAFGIYLIHAFILDRVLQHVGPNLPQSWPGGVRALTVWALAAGGAAAISSLMLFIPGLSRLVGRQCAWPQAVVWLRRASRAVWRAPRALFAKPDGDDDAPTRPQAGPDERDQPRQTGHAGHAGHVGHTAPTQTTAGSHPTAVRKRPTP